jgi:mannose-6-phosphate isomerase-like protein (cupin superfamily)
MPDPRPHTVVRPGQGELIDVAGDRYRFLADRDHTDGRYAIWEALIPPGGGPPPHLHHREEEGFYVLEGEITIAVDGERLVAGPGTFVNLPVGSLHAFRNESDRPARMLILIAPGGMEGMFRRAGTPVTDPDAPIPPMDETGVERLVAAAPDFGIDLHPPAG